ncbi:agregation promoting protein [Lactobacillus pasteurii DSM 23907 = CRBIP 24.76]|uniref:Single-strand binding protein n=1 Tax=Lactobacillus pasteurii DSM 23907 = CRBIP 24.76 TaxID=1423790 RepID=I7JXB4_9LACO|nr:hypothetical protein [Lactobacillus pasteurii]KRK07316.1 agregation promoting protein [Lactobacillus pasteurii DSM 23907 = CRBIP 24.76]TDG76797.1 hypothetical protein C5L33_001417 [Lactobacillus pasteurii]CCI84460.1 Single-strand binding protein [Lactobacillus pasteurii DSM 23907 = CRBIP 24.76]
MKIKAILTKSIVVAGLTVTGLVATASMNQNDVQAAVVQNDVAVYKVYSSTTVYNDYENPVATGQILAPNTSWKVIKTAYDAQGNKWYDLGKNQWVKVVNPATSTNDVVNSQTTSQTQTGSYSNSSYNNDNSYNSNITNTASYTSSASSSSEASAKAWIANRESGGSYTARNGQYYGKYQLTSSYLNGDYSAANQEKVADNYVKSRYGSWVAAKNFWLSNGWY